MISYYERQIHSHQCCNKSILHNTLESRQSYLYRPSNHAFRYKLIHAYYVLLYALHVMDCSQSKRLQKFVVHIYSYELIKH